MDELGDDVAVNVSSTPVLCIHRLESLRTRFSVRPRRADWDLLCWFIELGVIPTPSPAFESEVDVVAMGEEANGGHMRYPGSSRFADGLDTNHPARVVLDDYARGRILGQSCLPRVQGWARI